MLRDGGVGHKDDGFGQEKLNNYYVLKMSKRWVWVIDPPSWLVDPKQKNKPVKKLGDDIIKIQTTISRSSRSVHFTQSTA